MRTCIVRLIRNRLGYVNGGPQGVAAARRDRHRAHAAAAEDGGPPSKPGREGEARNDCAAWRPGARKYLRIFPAGHSASGTSSRRPTEP